MDDAAGIAPIAPLLADIDAIKTPADVQRVIPRLHDLGIAAPFGETGAPDNHEPTSFVLNLIAGGPGLPDRDAYLTTEPPALFNLPEFAQAFACKPGAPMVRPPEQRCAV